MLSRTTPVSYTQEEPSALWVIDHNLGEITVVNVVVDIDGVRHSIQPYDITHNLNQTLIQFSRPFSGSVRLV